LDSYEENFCKTKMNGEHSEGGWGVFKSALHYVCIWTD